MKEINLTMRYPKSRLEDVTDAYMRGFEVGMTMKKSENAKLRELVRELWNCALQYHRFDVYRHEIGVDGCGIGCTANGEGCCACKLEQRMCELGVEV